MNSYSNEHAVLTVICMLLYTIKYYKTSINWLLLSLRVKEIRHDISLRCQN